MKLFQMQSVRNLLFYVALMAFLPLHGQQGLPLFNPVYYDPGADTVSLDARWYPKLDSIADHLINHPSHTLNIYARGVESKDKLHRIYGESVQSAFSYLVDKRLIPSGRINLVLDPRHENGRIELRIVKGD